MRIPLTKGRVLIVDYDKPRIVRPNSWKQGRWKKPLGPPLAQLVGRGYCPPEQMNAMPGSVVRGMFTPWKIPSWVRPTDGMTAQELQAEARDMPPLLRAVGIYDAAVLSPTLVMIQYTRLMQYAGKMSFKPYLWYLLTVLLVPTIGGLAFYLFTQMMLGSDSGRIHSGRNFLTGADGPLYMGLVGGGVGLLFAWTSAYIALAAGVFKKAYAQARISQKPLRELAEYTGQEGQRATVGRLRIPLLRMAYADDETNDLTGTRFTGTDGHDGFLTGSLHLETRESVAEMTDPRNFYHKLISRSSGYIGGTTSERASRRQNAINAGHINANKRAAKYGANAFMDWMGRNKGLTFFLLCIGVSLLVLLVGWAEVQSVGESLGVEIP